ncbi:MAG: NAD(P)/FAD-dependent oxidoreductase [Isosphaeraceae bacterium]
MIAATLDLERAASQTWDVAVVGAGPAGALTAHQAARAGASVLLVERRAFPRPKVCGACLNGRALAALDAAGLGTVCEHEGALPLDRFEVAMRGRRAVLPLPGGKALDRATLDAALSREAIASGVDFLPETRARLVSCETASSQRTLKLESHGHSAQVSARVVVIAAGLASGLVDDEPGLSTWVSPSARIGAGCQVAEAPEGYTPGAILMAVAEGGYVGLVHIASGWNVAAAFDRDFVRSQGGPGEAAVEVIRSAGFPAFLALADADWSGTVALTRTTRPVASHRLFLIGDAAGYVEPFTGEGMGWAFASALAAGPLAAQGARDWSPQVAGRWIQEYNRLVGRRAAICRGLAYLSRRPLAARVALTAASWLPGVTAPLIRRLNAPPALVEVR